MKKIVLGILSLVLVSSLCYAADQKLVNKIQEYQKRTEKAAEYIKNNGLKAAQDKMVEERDSGVEDGVFYFDKSYFFCFDTKAKFMVHPRLYGTTMWKLKDVHGTYIMQNLINMAVKYGDGWVEYYWAKPGEVTSTVKSSYAKLVNIDGVDYVIGSGIYGVSIQDIYEIFPDEKNKKI